MSKQDQPPSAIPEAGAQYLSAEVIEAERISKTLGDDYVTRAGIWAKAARDLDLSLWAARRQLAQREAVIAQGQQENTTVKDAYERAIANYHVQAKRAEAAEGERDRLQAVVSARDAGIPPEAIETLIANAWWKGRQSVVRHPFGQVHGPELQRACADDLAALLSAVTPRPQDEKEQDDLSRSPSDGCASVTGSPRKSQPEGCRR